MSICIIYYVRYFNNILLSDITNKKKIYDNLGKAYKMIRNEDLYSSEYLFDVMSSYQIQEQQEDFKF